MNNIEIIEKKGYRILRPKEGYVLYKDGEIFEGDVILGVNAAPSAYSTIEDVNYKEIQIIVDPSASSFKEQLRRFRMKVKNAQNEVIDGIRIVSSMIKSGRYFISKECPNTIKEKGLYSWDEKKQLEGIDSPKKLYDHCSDAERYGLYLNRDKETTVGGRRVGV